MCLDDGGSRGVMGQWHRSGARDDNSVPRQVHGRRQYLPGDSTLGHGWIRAWTNCHKQIHSDINSHLPAAFDDVAAAFVAGPEAVHRDECEAPDRPHVHHSCTTRPWKTIHLINGRD